jgi:hypothetical protein
VQRDPSKVVDATKDRATDWSEKIASGELVPTSGHAKHNANTPGFLHIQGRPITEEQAKSRVVPASVMEYVAKTGRYPHRSGPKYFGGVDFNPDGSLKRDEEEQPS